MKTVNLGSVMKKLAKNKYVLLVLLLGLVLILIPGGSGGGDAVSAAQSGSQALEATGVALHTESEILAELLEQIEGVGKTSVLLSHEGAVIVCEGASSAQVRLDVTNAVSSYTGLGSDKITVMKMK